MSTPRPLFSRSVWIFSDQVISVFQSSPRMVNSIGLPLLPAKPCCDRSWTATLMPAICDSSRRIVSEIWVCVIDRWPGSTIVSDSDELPMLTVVCTPVISGCFARMSSAFCVSRSVSVMSAPIDVRTDTCRRLWSCDGTISCLSCVIVQYAPPISPTAMSSTSTGTLSATSSVRE